MKYKVQYKKTKIVEKTVDIPERLIDEYFDFYGYDRKDQYPFTDNDAAFEILEDRKELLEGGKAQEYVIDILSVEYDWKGQS